MAQAVGLFAQHTFAFAKQCLGSGDVRKKNTDVENFLWTAQRVVFAVGFFFLMRAIKPHLSSMELSLLCNITCFFIPEASLGIGSFLVYRSAHQFFAAASYARPEVLMLHGTINLISGMIALKWFDKNLKDDHFMNDAFSTVAKTLAPRIARSI
jgi:hypothetical protein